MDLKKYNFIQYRDFGYNMSHNLLISFLTSYPETRVSNDYLCKKLSLSGRQVKRIIGDLTKDNIVIVNRPTVRIRIMKLNVDIIKKILEGQNEPQVGVNMNLEGDNMTLEGDNMSLEGDNMSLKGDNMSLKGDNMTPYNKPYQNLCENPHSETRYKNPDNKNITTKSILQSIIEDEKFRNNH